MTCLGTMKNLHKKYYENSDKKYALEVDFKYHNELHDLHVDLSFLPEKVTIDKCDKPTCNLYDKKVYITHINALKKALDHGLILENLYWVTGFN